MVSNEQKSTILLSIMKITTLEFFNKLNIHNLNISILNMILVSGFPVSFKLFGKIIKYSVKKAVNSVEWYSTIVSFLKDVFGSPLQNILPNYFSSISYFYAPLSYFSLKTIRLITQENSF